MHPANYPILLHLLVEVPAAASFTLQPSKQLRDAQPSPEAVLICRSYGGLLWAVNLLCLQFLVRRGDICDHVAGMLAVSLAVYHTFPMFRAANRIWSRDLRQQQQQQQQQQRQSDALGGPALHLIIHAIVFVSLSWGWVSCNAVKG